MGSRAMRAIKARVTLHWGYSVKRPIFSAAQPVLKVPPPTVLVGALARAQAYVKRTPEVVLTNGSMYSSVVSVLDEVKWASLALVDERFVNPLVGLIETKDVIRAVIAPYQRRDNVYPGSPMLFGVQPHGKVYAPGMEVLVFFILGGSRPADYAYGITTLGSKESIASVSEVCLSDLKVLEEDEVGTVYYFPRRLARAVEGRYIIELLSTPHKSHYELAKVKDLKANWEEYVIPLGRVKVKLSGEATAVVEPEGGAVVVPREVVELA